MAVNRKQFPASVRRFFTQFDQWKLDPKNVPNLVNDAFEPEDLAAKAKKYKKVIDETIVKVTKPLDMKENWDTRWGKTGDKATRAAHLYRFGGDLKQSLAWLDEALDSYEECTRPHFTFSSCLGVMDLDLRTAHAVNDLTIVRYIFGDHLPAATRKRIDKVVLERCLKPGLISMRTKQYPWMHSTANWRIILCGSFAFGAMGMYEQVPEYREFIEYALEGVLVALETGDAEGGWNEGPGYWDYGLSFAGTFATALRTFTHGAVDLFEHPFLKKTGDFKLYMHTTSETIWNWSDCGKMSGPSSMLTMLARVYRNPEYQDLVLKQGIQSIGQLYLLDDTVPRTGTVEAPLTKHFPGSGVFVARTGFADKDAFVGIKAGDIPDYNHHCQMDSGQVVIFAEGRELLAENEHWGYPLEGSKDPKAPRPSRPGLYDEEMKRFKRWDMDSVSAFGHNIPIVEGHYPQPVLKVPPKLTIVAQDRNYDIVSVDSSVYYKPAASKVRRLVVYLRPDIVLIADQIVATKPIRASLLYHYLEHGRIDGHNFEITDGPARLLISPLSPTLDNNLIVGAQERFVFYERPVEGIVKVRNRYLYLENLWRKKRLVFVTAMFFGNKHLKPAKFELEGDSTRDDTFTVKFETTERSGSVAFDVAKQTAKVK